MLHSVLLVFATLIAAHASFADPARKPDAPIAWPEPVRVHLVALVDDEDPRLGRAASVSLEKVTALVEDIGQALDLPVERSVFGSSTPFDTVIEAVRSADYSRDIALVFYFGHGGRRETEPSRIYDLPRLKSFGLGDPMDLIEAVLDDRPHLALFLLDACNTPLGPIPERIRGRVELRNAGLARGDADYRYLYTSPKTVSGYSMMFAETYGFMVLASTRPGQTAYFNGTQGGLMTHLLLESIERELTKYTPRWDRIFPDYMNLRISYQGEDIQSPTGSICYVGPSGEIRCNQGFSAEAEAWAADRGAHPTDAWLPNVGLEDLNQGRYDLGQAYFNSILAAGRSYADEGIGLATRLIGRNIYTGTGELYGVEMLEQLGEWTPKAHGLAGESLLALADWGTTGVDPVNLYNRAFDNLERAAAAGDTQALFNILVLSYFELDVPPEIVARYEAMFFEKEADLPPHYTQWRDEICEDADFGICR